MNCTKWKRLQLRQVLFLLSGLFLCTLYHLTIGARPYKPFVNVSDWRGFGDAVEEARVEILGLEEPVTAAQEVEPTDQTTPEIHVLYYTDTTKEFKASTSTEAPLLPTKNQTDISVASEMPHETPTLDPGSPGEAPHMKSEYPKDLFSVEDRRRGWVILHMFGMMYMFISLAIVCDEFFIPALGVITDKLAISDDVAGATVMAAGRPAPKLFASLIGVFIAHSNVGIGTIVGSAVFNILFVIGMCALFSREVLQLTWWPLFRDVSFYILDLIMLIIFFLDNVIMWWESMMLVTGCTLYVIFMKFNVQIEQAFKTQLHRVIAAKEAEKGVSAGEEEQGGTEDAESAKDVSERINPFKNHETGEREQVKGKSKNTPLTLQWPNTRRKQATYLFLLPIIVPLWITVPDVRNQKSRKFFVVTFLGSILWIAVFSYLMVWWAHQVGETIGIPEEIMGLTVLAVGTSAPDLISSVSVARKGLADMVLSSSVGSNIFNITVGLPAPWLLYSLIHRLAPVAVSSSGLLCAISLLFIMLLFVIISIVSCKWKMNKALGLAMVLLYSIFVALSIMLQYRFIVCPVG